MHRISKGINSARSLRASVEFCLGSFRLNIEVSAFTKTKQQTCFCCGINIVKRCDNHSLRRWYTIVHIFKTTLYALYYRRSLFDRNGSVIIRTFNHHLRAIKRAAKERKSDILDNILFLPEKDDSVIPFYKILNEIHQDTALYRRQDNKDFCFLSDYQKRLSRTQNFHQKQNIPKMSQEKRQLLIENAFKRTYNRTSLSQVQGIDLCNND